jgi:hypothetical protein
MEAVNKCIYRPGPSPTKSTKECDPLILSLDVFVSHEIPQMRKHRNMAAPSVFKVMFTDTLDIEPITSGKPVELTEIKHVLSSRFPNFPHIVCYTFHPEGIMSALNVHSLDERLTFIGSSAGSFHIEWKETGFKLEILDLSAFFPHTEFSAVLDSYGVKPSSVARETLELAVKLRAAVLQDFGLDIVQQKTPGMLAAKIFSTQHLTEPVGMVRKAIRTQGMLSYWSGNNQAFGRGEFLDDLRMYDAVSMYPSSCIQMQILPLADDWYRMIDSDIQICSGGVLRVEFQFPADELYPCLPVASLDSLYFPLSGISDCTVWEVRHALEIGATVKLVSGWAYMRGNSDLARYSARLLDLKNAAELSGDTARRNLYKMLANSVFGKLAQKRLEETLQDKRIVAAALGYSSIFEMVSTDNWQLQAEQILGAPVPIRATVGGLWCPEWAALVNGYARAVESRAMRDNGALLGTTDNVIIQALPGDPEEFSVMGIRYVLKEKIAVLKIIRSRLYVYLTEDGELDGALHGFPASREMLEAVYCWNGEDFQRTYRVPAETKLREGLLSGKGAGVPYLRKWQVSFNRDTKRLPAGNFSVPHPFIDQRI